MRWMPCVIAVGCAVLVCMLGGLPTQAAIMTFSDRATFLAATGATDATGPLPDLGTRDSSEIPNSSTTTVGTVTFFAPRWFMGTLGNPSVVGGDWTTLLPGNDIAISDGTGNNPTGAGDDGIDVTFASPVFSAGFDFSESSLPGVVQDGCYTTPCVTSTFLVTLKNGSVTVGSFSFDAPDDVAAFVGVWSSVEFTHMEIRETTGTDDDEFYGHFYTGTTPAPPAPSLTLSPPSGAYVTTQIFDLAAIIAAANVSVVGGSAFLDGVDKSAEFGQFCIPGTLTAGGLTFRCPDLSGAVLGTGLHTIDVCLLLSDSSQVCDTVTWDVHENTEP